MADFKTHLVGASLVTGLASTLVVVATGSTEGTAIGYFAAGVTGGLLPDVDLETSTPVRIARRVVSTVGTLLVVLRFASEYSLVELALLAAGTYMVLVTGFELFGRATSHRGLVHSVPAGAAAGLVTGILAERALGTAPLEAWFYAAFMALGFATHLVLDEIYSVDIGGVRLKRSFGSAVSVGDRDNLLGTTALYAAVVALALLSPPADDFLAVVGDAGTYSAVASRLLPG